MTSRIRQLAGFTMEAVSISTDPAPPNIFEIPEGFKKQDWTPPNS